MMLKISKTIQIIQLLALSIIKAYIVDLFSKNSYRLLPVDIFCKKQEIVYRICLTGSSLRHVHQLGLLQLFTLFKPFNYKKRFSGQVSVINYFKFRGSLVLDGNFQSRYKKFMP